MTEWGLQLEFEREKGLNDAVREYRNNQSPRSSFLSLHV